MRRKSAIDLFRDEDPRSTIVYTRPLPSDRRDEDDVTAKLPPPLSSPPLNACQKEAKEEKVEHLSPFPSSGFWNGKKRKYVTVLPLLRRFFSSFPVSGEKFATGFLPFFSPARRLE